ncbi:MAG: murein biosynthesis integral membrane protein MurJ [Gammaproteobacteria bacterium]|nr:murein biosynthesis integral membrane protein MurJ [Gammaproteobacteria bacterium]
MTLVSRVLGLVRDVVMARLLGASAGADAFFVAFRIPNFLRRLFGEGAFSQAFVPVLSEYRAQRTHAEAKELVDHVAGSLGLVLFIITAVAVVAAPLVIMVFAPGFVDHGSKYELTVAMTRIMFPYLLFISLTAMAGGILNSYGHFAVPAFAPVFLNLCLIAAVLWGAPYFEQPVMALAWGVFIAGVIQLLSQFPSLARIGLLPRPRLGKTIEGVQRIKQLMLPALFGSSVMQINLLFDTLIASFLVTGSVSWLYYSERLVEFPLGVFGIALATAVLPNLSRKHAETDPAAFSRTLDWSLRMVFLVSVPAALGLIVMAEPLIIAFFNYGEFTAHDVQMSRLALIASSLGLLAFILVKVLVTGFYARQDLKTPVRIGIIAMVSNMVLNVLIVVPLLWLDAPGPHMGLALATTASSYINAALLYRRLRRDQIYQPLPGWGKWLLQLLVGSVAMTAILWWAMPVVDVWRGWGWGMRGGMAVLFTMLGGATFVAGLWISGVRMAQIRSGKA